MMQLSICATVEECKETFSGEKESTTDAARSLAIECLGNLLDINDFNSASKAVDAISGENASQAIEVTREASKRVEAKYGSLMSIIEE